ncbi:MAG: AAA family ATPase [Pseudomonadota bacterium]
MTTSPRRIVISGCSGGGKSTLIAAMAARGFPTMAEPGREVVRAERARGGGALPWTAPAAFAETCLVRATRDFDAARAGPRPTLYDRSLVDAVAALERAGGQAGPEVLTARRYDRTVFLAPPWPDIFAADAERRHDFPAAEAEYHHLLRRYPEAGYEVVLLPKAPVPERVAFLDAALAEHCA